MYKQESPESAGTELTSKNIERDAMNTSQIIKDALNNNDEVRLVLEIAARAREVEARELPREITPSADAIAIPIHPQRCV